MPRTTSYSVTANRILLTPLQRWLMENVCSHRHLISRRRVGLVLWARPLRHVTPFLVSGPRGRAVERGATSRPLITPLTAAGISTELRHRFGVVIPLKRFLGDETINEIGLIPPLLRSR